MEGVTKTYRTKHEDIAALAPINCTINAGQFVSIVGPSGCGKSTLLRAVAGLNRPTAGAITIGETKIEGPYTDLGIVFQRDLLMEWRRVLPNIVVQGRFRNTSRAQKLALVERARGLLSMVGLDGIEGRYPNELSGGMRQRVSICRALVHNPPLLLMDEPFGAVDALMREQMALDIQAICSTGTTVLLVTHSISEAVFLGDRVLVFGPRPGALVADVTVDLPRPRLIDVRQNPTFGKITQRIRHIFESMGVIGQRRIGDDPISDGLQGFT